MVRRKKKKEEADADRTPNKNKDKDSKHSLDDDDEKQPLLLWTNVAGTMKPFWARGPLAAGKKAFRQDKLVAEVQVCLADGSGDMYVFSSEVLGGRSISAKKTRRPKQSKHADTVSRILWDH